MNLLYLTYGREDWGSTRYRALQWIPFLEKREWNVEWIFSRHIRIRKFIKIVKMCYWADIVVVQKKLFVRPFLFLIRALSKRLLFDYDDALFTRDPFTLRMRSTGNGSPKSIRRLNFSLKLADTVIAGSKHLFDYAAKINDDVKIVPTCIVYSDYSELELVENKVLSIGWLGTANNQGYLTDIAEELESITIKYPKVNLQVISDKALKLQGVRIDNIKWNIDSYKNALLKFDLGIMPLKNDEWSKGKCAFKIIQYMAAGLPVIASDVGANSTVISNSEDGYLVNSSDEWLSAFEKLIESKELREKMGRAAKEKIRKNFSAEAWIDKYEFILLS